MGQYDKAVYIPECFYVQTIRAGSTEQSGFSVKYLTRLECEDQLIKYIQQAQPQFLPLIIGRKMNAIARIMKQIVTEHVYREYDDLFKELHKSLQEEWTHLVATGEDIDLVSADAKLAYKSKTMFVLKNTGVGVCVTIKKIIKKILFWIKQNLSKIKCTV